MSGLGGGTWSVAVTARAPAYQVDEFLEHYIGLGADRVFLFFDDEAYSSYDAPRFSGKVISFVCNDAYWATAFVAPPMLAKIGRPDAIEIRQGANALFAREIMHSDWLLHVDVDEFIYAKKNVQDVLGDIPGNVFSVLLRTLEAVYDEVKLPGQEAKTNYFKKSVGQRDLLKQIYSEEILSCANNGLFGTITGKSFIRKHPEIKSMSVHWPFPVDLSLKTNVSTYYIDLLHFEGQSFQLFKDKFKLRVYKNVAKYMPATYKVRLDICKREFDLRGEQGLLNVYKDLYVMPPDKLKKAIDLGIVVEVDWSLGGISNHKILINNPIYDLGSRISNWSGTILKTFHNSYMVYDSSLNKIRAGNAAEVVRNKNVIPVEIEVFDSEARLFVRSGHKLLKVSIMDGDLIASPEPANALMFNFYTRDGFSFLQYKGKYLSVSPSNQVTVIKEAPSLWERLQLKDIHPQLS